jgi:hypothetical protein
MKSALCDTLKTVQGVEEAEQELEIVAIEKRGQNKFLLRAKTAIA